NVDRELINASKLGSVAYRCQCLAYRRKPAHWRAHPTPPSILALRLIAQCTICRASSVLKPMARIFISTFALAFVASIPTQAREPSGRPNWCRSGARRLYERRDRDRTDKFSCVAPRSRAYLDE